VLERLAFQKLHGDEALTIAFVNFMNCANVGMIQGRRARFPLEAFQCLAVLGQLLREELSSACGQVNAEAVPIGFLKDFPLLTV